MNVGVAVCAAEEDPAKAAVTLLEASIVTTQVPLPIHTPPKLGVQVLLLWLHAPVHPEKVDPGPGIAVRVRFVPAPSLFTQVPLVHKVIPLKLPDFRLLTQVAVIHSTILITVPLPVPASVIVRGYVVMLGTKIALTFSAAVTLIVQVLLLPLHAPPQS